MRYIRVAFGALHMGDEDIRDCHEVARAKPWAANETIPDRNTVYGYWNVSVPGYMYELELICFVYFF